MTVLLPEMTLPSHGILDPGLTCDVNIEKLEIITIIVIFPQLVLYEIEDKSLSIT